MNAQSSWFINRSFLLKILLPVAMTLVLFVVALYQIVIPRFEEIVLDRKREMIRELTETVWHIADSYHQDVLRGRMTDEEAQASTIRQVQNLRYGEEGKDYFWITDFQPRMIVHPFRDDLNGADLSDFKDSEGKALFVEIVQVVRAKGQGYVDYTWQWKDDSTRIVPKLSYVKPFTPWNWIIGTGIYIEDVRSEIAALESNVVNISIWITVSISLLLLFIVVQNLRSERKRQQAERDLRESKEKYEALVEASTEGLLMVMEDRQLYFNKSLLAMLGYGEDEARELDLKALFSADVVETVFGTNDAEQIRNALNSHAETRLTRRDGSTVEVLLTVSPVGFYGKTGVVVIVKDLSHSKLIADALDESRQRFSTLTNRLSLAVFRTDADKAMRFVEANAATTRLFGYGGLDELQKADLREHFDDTHAFELMTDDLSRIGFVTNRVVRIRKVDKTSVMISLSVAIVPDDVGQPRYCDVLAEDVSEENRSREDAERLMADLRAPISFLHQPIRPFVRESVLCGMSDPVTKVARLMSRLQTDIVLVQDDAQRIVGLISNDELRDHLRGENNANERSAYEIMRAPVEPLRDSAMMYDVLTAFQEKGLAGFAVKDESGVVRGTVLVSDILKSRLNTYGLFLQRLRHAESVGEVRDCQGGLTGYVRLLIESSADVRTVTHATTIISDTVVERLIDIALAELGPPPRPFVFMALGSEGRSEQSLVTDQDNAIVYADECGDESDGDVRAYFLALGDRVCRGLDSVGYAYCKGDVMASNPKWCRPLRDWKQYFSDWVNTANPQDLLEVSIFFDFRGVYGDTGITERLRDHLFSVLGHNTSFFLYLSQNALRVKPPTRQFKTVDQVDSKWALLPITDIARIYSLKHKVRATNTLERLSRLRELDVFSSARYMDIVHAHAFLMTQRYRRQAAMLESNSTPDNIIDTHALTDIEKLVLRRVLAQIEEFQAKLGLDFKGTV
jgi:PAS domain S-box-containing protein